MTPERNEPSRPVSPAPVSPLSILAVDDDPDFREYVRSVLEPDGHEIRTCASPEEFFRAGEERLPDIVLLDIKMGDASGEQILTEIRRRWRKLCVIVVTGYPSLDSMRQTFRQEVFDYIAKPFSISDLQASIAAAATSFGLGRRPQDRLRHELGRRIRLVRIDKDWTLKDLSEHSGVSVSQLSSIERGAHLPSIESMLSIAQALGQRPSEWLTEAGF